MTDSVISERPVEHWTAQRRRGANEKAGAAAASGARARLKAGMSRERRRRPANVVPLAFGIAVAVVLWIGWLNRGDNGLTPESGVGYWLGIAGSGLMLLLLAYPRRPRRVDTLATSLSDYYALHVVALP